MIENNGNLDKSRCKQLIEELDHLQGVEGFIYKNYSYEGTEGQEFRRMYFSDFNAKKCDAIRIAIENWLGRIHRILQQRENFSRTKRNEPGTIPSPFANNLILNFV